MITRKTILSAMLLVTCAGQREGWNPVESLIKHIVKNHLLDCGLVLLIPRLHSPDLLGALREAAEGIVLITTLSDHHLLRAVLGMKTSKCRAVVYQLSEGNDGNKKHDLSVLQSAGLWKLPETRVLLVGGKETVKSSLFHPSLRNTIHCLYLALNHIPASNTTPPGPSLLLRSHYNVSTLVEEVTVYRRCLFCNRGENGIQYIGRLNVSSDFHLDNWFLEADEEMLHFKGHKIKVIAAPYFPYIAYKRDNDEPGTTVTPTYSVDAYLMSTFATHLNFTYSMREEPEGIWGLETDGMFNGMIGQLQREEVDFCTIAGPSPGRLRVIDFLRSYPSDLMTVVTLKPSFLPQHLSLIRPFSGMVWASVFTCMAAWGAALWILHQAFQTLAKRQSVQIDAALLYSWGSLLEESIKTPVVNVSAQIMVGCWLLFCLIITSSFKSSLIAHLTIQGKSHPPDTLADLVNSEGWGWAIEPWLLNGVPLEYFSKHPDPIVQTIHKEKQVLVADEALKKVLKGQFALLDLEKYITIIIDSRYSDERGRSPFQISKKVFSIMAVFGWGVRKGALYYNRFQQVMNRLEDAGIIEHWTEDVIARHVRERRKDAEPFLYRSRKDFLDDSLLQVAFGLRHLQGTFYILFIGFSMAFLSMLLEVMWT